MSGSACKERYFLFCETCICLIFGKQFCHSSTGKWGKDLSLHSYGTENLRYINAVHNRSQHTDLVSLGPVDLLAGTASPEVASSDHDTNFQSIVNEFFYLTVTVGSSNPVFLSPASASPLNFNNTLFM